MALHVTTEVGKPGRHERERRHFPESRGTAEVKSQPRRYIPHGRSAEQPPWRPHGKHLKPSYTE